MFTLMLYVKNQGFVFFLLNCIRSLNKNKLYKLIKISLWEGLAENGSATTCLISIFVLMKLLTELYEFRYNPSDSC
jgi:hypothetical protein